MATTHKKKAQEVFYKITSSPQNYNTCDDDTHYVCVFCRFHDKKWLRVLFSIITSSLLKLANHAMHGGETWYACVFQCFHDNHQKMTSGSFPYKYFFTSQTCKPCNAWRQNLVHMYISAFPSRLSTKIAFLGTIPYKYFFISQTHIPYSTT